MGMKILPAPMPENRGLNRRSIPVIIFGMDTAQLLADLFKRGWALQVSPEVSPFGVIYATMIWSLRRDPMEETLDGAEACLPIIQRVNLVEKDSFARFIRAFHGRIFPINPLGDLPVDSPFRDL